MEAKLQQHHDSRGLDLDAFHFRFCCCYISWQNPGQIKGMQILSNLTHLKQKNPFVLGHTAAAHRAASLQHSAAQPAIQPSSWQAPYLSLAPI